MRRALRKELPALCAVYGLAPWDVERMSVAEIGEFFSQIGRFAPS